jgi:hypothetical protein
MKIDAGFHTDIDVEFGFGEKCVCCKDIVGKILTGAQAYTCK